MARVTGIGGIFFKSENPRELRQWYERNLGVKTHPMGPVVFFWRDQDDPEKVGQTIWSAFPKDTDYFGPSGQPYMVNFRVDDLDAILKNLRAAGAQVDDKIEEQEYGRFGWVTDPDGQRIELWEPKQAESL